MIHYSSESSRHTHSQYTDDVSGLHYVTCQMCLFIHQAALVYCDYYQGGGSQLNTAPRMLYLKTAFEPYAISDTHYRHYTK